MNFAIYGMTSFFHPMTGKPTMTSQDELDLKNEKVQVREELERAKQRFFATMDKALEDLLNDLNRKEGKHENGIRGG